MSAVGGFIETERKKSGLSIREVAKQCGISHSEVNKIENGQRANPAPLHLKAIARVLNLNYLNVMTLAGYIDESDMGKSENSISELCCDFSEEEMDKVCTFINFIRSQR